MYGVLCLRVCVYGLLVFLLFRWCLWLSLFDTSISCNSSFNFPFHYIFGSLCLYASNGAHWFFRMCAYACICLYARVCVCVRLCESQLALSEWFSSDNRWIRSFFGVHILLLLLLFHIAFSHSSVPCFIHFMLACWLLVFCFFFVISTSLSR